MSSINSLTIQNFTAFKQADLRFSAGINVFIGENATGKTHLLKLIYALAKRIVNEKNALLPPNLKTIFRPENTAAELIRANLPMMEASQDSIIVLNNGYKLQIAADGRATFSTHAQGIPVDRPVLFIPSREILSIYPGFLSAYQLREIPYDETYFDLALSLNAAPLRENKYHSVKHLGQPLENILGGDNKVSLENDHFFIDMSDAGKLEANLVAEGYRKLATLVHLIRNGSLTPNTILLWDEPEANLNPKLMVAVADFLINFANAGGQVFVATHDYLFTQELSLRSEYKQTKKEIKFFSLFRDPDYEGVQVETGNMLHEIDHNPILDAHLHHIDREDQLLYGQASVTY
ncbi:MAG: AAA family ATPase [Anaerolineales bacterium]|nr:AAA family ATPase [Anaerolineales bacterium]